MQIEDMKNPNVDAALAAEAAYVEIAPADVELVAGGITTGNEIRPW